MRHLFATVLGIGFLLLIFLVLNAWIAAMRIAVPRAATFMILYLVTAVLFAALYKIVPDVGLKWSDVALGAMITSLLFMIGKQFMGLYFAHASFGSLDFTRPSESRRFSFRFPVGLTWMREARLARILYTAHSEPS